MTFGEITDEAKAKKIFDRCLEVAVNFFDTANADTGSQSEQIPGR